MVNVLTSSFLLSVFASAFAQRSFSFTNTTVDLGGASPYQVAVGVDGKYVYVTSSIGRPPVTESTLFKINAASLEVETSITPAVFNETNDYLYAVYGIGSDNKNGNIWVTNTRQNTVSVYKQDDLSLVKQFPPGSVAHSRDAFVDEPTNQVFVSSATTPLISVFDAVTLENTRNITLNVTGPVDSAMTLDIDPDTGILYTVDLKGSHVVTIDTRNGDKIDYHYLEGALELSGATWDPSRNHFFAVSQASDGIVVVELPSGNIIKNITDVPQGGFSAEYDQTNDLVYFTNRPEAAIYVVDADSLELIAKLDTLENTNHVVVDSRGVAYVVDKGKPAAKLWRIEAKLNDKPVPSPSSNSTSHAEPTESKTTSGNVTISTDSGVYPVPTGSVTVTATETVITTYCPEPTTLTWGGHTVTVEEATTLTLTCTVCPAPTKSSDGGDTKPTKSGGHPASTSNPAPVNGAAAQVIGVGAGVAAVVALLI